MRQLVLRIQSNIVAKAVLNVVAEWKVSDELRELRQKLATYIAEGENFSAAQMRLRGTNKPLRVRLLPSTLDDVVALANALSDIPEAPLWNVLDYIRDFYPEESVSVAFAGEGEPVRLRNALQRARYYTLSQIRAASDEEILRIPRVDTSSLGRIRRLSAPKSTDSA
ncbi:MAG TPA: hypothetical protein VFT87_01540 [Candidatus Saccharimonadales bacterium]|nr:hypothetical protein [Candidatus Saccharimonadales bacterium]